MSGKMNKFMKQLEANGTAKTSTDEIVEKLYSEEKEEKPAPAKKETAKEKTAVRKTGGKKVGRPKERTDEKYLQVHLIMPESLKNEIQKAIICHRTNMNSYLLDLIKADLKKNGSDYNSVYETITRIGH